MKTLKYPINIRCDNCNMNKSGHGAKMEIPDNELKVYISAICYGCGNVLKNTLTRESVLQILLQSPGIGIKH